MKQILKIKTIVPVFLLLFMLSMTGCSDEFLNVVPEGTYTEDNYYASDEALRLVCDPLYNRAWFGFHERSMLGLGSLRSNDAFNPYFTAEFTRFQTTALTAEVGKAWSSVYAVVSMSNAVIEGVKNKCGPDVTQAAKDKAMGEAYLMRATAFFFGVRIWGPMILSEDNTDMILHPIRPLNPEEDVFTFIIRDMRRACELLPNDNSGRATVWSAKAMLAKVLLAHSGWNEATRDEAELAECIKLCEEVIDNSGASLIEYEDLFKYQYNFNSESLLAMRWATLGPWGTQNTLISDLSFPDVCDVGCWNHNMSASIDMIELYNEEPNNHDAIRRKATFFIPGEHYDYIKSAHGGYTYPKNTANEGWMQVKKGVLGSKEDTDGMIDQQNSPLHTYIIRLADVYLMHAEASLGNQAELTNGRGLDSYNTVRNRARVITKDKITFEDIIKERRIEFCMEYQTWFEMITWYRWKPDYMLDYFNNQYRGYEIRDGGIRVNPNGTISWQVYDLRDEDVTNADGSHPKKWDTIEGYNNSSYVPAVINKDNIFIPYPERDRLQNHYLSKAPEPYDFSKYNSE